MKLALLVILLGAVWVASAQPARIILIRHAEKPEDPEEAHLSPAGQERAQRLVKWLSAGKVLGTNGPPVLLYAPAPTRRGHGVRCLETLQPTASELHQTVFTPYPAADYASLAKEVLNNRIARGKNVVICWIHDYLPAFATSLGVKKMPGKWKSSDFESAYVITFPKGKAKLEMTREKLKKP